MAQLPQADLDTKAQKYNAICACSLALVDSISPSIRDHTTEKPFQCGLECLSCIPLVYL